MERLFALMKLKPLTAMRLRALWALRAQVLAVALVVGSGVAIFVMMNGILSSLQLTRAAYYSENQLADVWAPAVRIPAPVVDEMATHPDIFRIEPRIVAGVQVDVASAGGTVKGRILSLKDGAEPKLNKPYLVAGTWPGTGDGNILLDSEFAGAHDLRPGDTIHAVIYGVRRQLTISGTAMSPEFIYAIPPGELVPDAARYAQIWMDERALSYAFDMDGAYRQVTMRLRAGADRAGVIAFADRLLEPYGGVGAYGRDQHLSDQFLESEFNQLRTLGGFLPIVFLAVAAFLLNILTTRIVEQERKQIGLMKAFGYSDRRIILHYMFLSLTMVTVGVIIGLLAGARFGEGLAGEYQVFFHFPVLVFEPEPDVYLKAAALAYAAAVGGVMFAVRKLKGLRPAVAMAPPVPTDYTGGVATNMRWMDEGFRLVIRHLTRWPWRSAFTALGISFAMMIVVGAHSMFDAVTHMMDLQFTVVNRQHVTVHFTEKESWPALHDIDNMDGVLVTEPYVSVPAKFSHGLQTKHMSLTGLTDNLRLSRVVDEDNQPVRLATHGLTLSESMADLLDVRIGDPVTIRILTGKRRTITLPVAGIVTTWIGIGAYVPMDRLFDLLGEGERLSGAHLLVDGGRESALIEALQDMPQVIGVGRNREAREAMDALMDQNMNTMNFFNSMFATMIAFGVIYSSARIMISERRREIATLKVLGFRDREINQILLGELAILTAIALPVGIGLGKLLVKAVMTQMESELFRMPEVTSWYTIGYATMVICLSLAISAITVMRRVRKLDKVAALQAAG